MSRHGSSDTPLTHCPHERNFEVLPNCLSAQNNQGILQSPSVRKQSFCPQQIHTFSWILYSSNNNKMQLKNKELLESIIVKGGLDQLF